ncbi:MAG: cupin [Rhodospirillales bacterium]|jgi:hypothetical protein|nr:cupin [Rhodospirillales bacterium]MBT4038622.1 cupin [Rhodospirillales bacterium]MBT4627618.1 cupin [Rhodospirillales bacterium]MBT5351537.1 cupin [Rhodospirillales bacterium]MBT5521511.1 cupin [Rhodospirillales bacterium]
MSAANDLAEKVGNILDPALRSIINTEAGDFRPYDRYGVELPGMTWLPLSLDSTTGVDLFLLRFAPGAQSMPHEHMAAEQFLMMEGELTDCDGHVFRAGEFARFEPGSTHHSHSVDGCLILVILQSRNRSLNSDPNND